MRKIAISVLGLVVFGTVSAQPVLDACLRARAPVAEEKQADRGDREVDRPLSRKIRVKIDWDQVVRVSRASATLQAIPNPSHQRGSALHGPLWNALRELRADFVRYSPWGEYPNLKIAALRPPADGKTSWDFSALDPVFIDFMNAVGQRPIVMNYQAIPGWMMIKPKPEKATHEIGSLFRDPTGKEVADYFARIVQWYTKGGFRDELGKWHDSGHAYKISYWEVLNEPDHESIAMTKELYTSLYDAVVTSIRQVAPEMKFMGLSLANLPNAPGWTEYFLERKNHDPGTPLDMVSYHMYATIPAAKNTPDQYPHTVFEKADESLETITIVDSIRRKLSPDTVIDINESGILFKDVPKGWGRMDGDSIPDSFWNLSAAYYAYIYAGLAYRGIEIIGESTLWSDPKDWPEVSLLDWKTGKPNARYWVLKLIRENFGPGDKLVETDVDTADGESPVLARGFVTSAGARKILLVNKTNRAVHLSIPGVEKGRVTFVDQTTAFEPPASMDLERGSLSLGGFGVAAVTVE